MDDSPLVPAVAFLLNADGTVVRFDEDAGLGLVRSDAGSEFGFHATAVANGSRSIEVGARVTFRLVPANLGVIEASAIRELN